MRDGRVIGQWFVVSVPSDTSLRLNPDLATHPSTAVARRSLSRTSHLNAQAHSVLSTDLKAYGFPALGHPPPPPHVGGDT